MTNTEKKLSEAKFFLKKLKNSKEDPQQFEYYLSAFLSSSRSITWVMSNEFHEVEGWNEWWNSKIASDSEKELLKIFTNMRNSSVKSKLMGIGYALSIEVTVEDLKDAKVLKKFIQAGKKYKVILDVPIEEASLKSAFRDSKLILNEIGKTLQIQNVKFLEVERTVIVPGNNNGEILSLLNYCDTYLNILEQLVHDWLSLQK